ncbi:MAG: purine-nucleoside phosphorylase [Elusimicrobia bacterium]|nr:purine-nucleoside phosphorylase [Elusimicrobiota bacterium]
MEVKTYVSSIRKAADFIRKKSKITPNVAVILGSGLSKAVPNLQGAVTIPYTDIPNFPRTTVAGHEGKLVMGKLGGAGVAVLQGRFHYYEGHSMESIALPTRALEYLGAKTLVVTAAVGSMRKQFKPGDIVAVTDHINFMGRNPLRAFHEEEFGDMFPDLRNAYDPALRKLAHAICKKKKFPIHEGVYVAVGGPSYETPAEIRAFRAVGADVVGMSVVPEVIPARQMGMRVLGLSWISNFAAGMSDSDLSHHDVLALGEQFSKRLRVLLDELLPKLVR